MTRLSNIPLFMSLYLFVTIPSFVSLVFAVPLAQPLEIRPFAPKIYDYPTEVEKSWVLEPRTRGSIGLLWSCTFTILLAVWSTLHLNMQMAADATLDDALGESPTTPTPWFQWIRRQFSPKHRVGWKYKFFWALLTLVVPELPLAVALGELWTARDLLKQLEVKKVTKEAPKEAPQEEPQAFKKWDLTMAFYVVMGGFYVHHVSRDRQGPHSLRDRVTWVNRRRLQKFTDPKTERNIAISTEIKGTKRIVTETIVIVTDTTVADTTVKTTIGNPRYDRRYRENHHQNNQHRNKERQKKNYTEEIVTVTDPAVARTNVIEGTAIENITDDKARDVLTPHGFLYIARLLQDLKEKNTERDNAEYERLQRQINDMNTSILRDLSKTNTVAKVIVFLQAAWIIVQVTGRFLEPLPVALLELHTAAHSVCAIIMYATWWYKPMDIFIATPIFLTEDQYNTMRTKRTFDATNHLRVPGYARDFLRGNKSNTFPDSRRVFSAALPTTGGPFFCFPRRKMRINIT
ncbi:hypothetical protein FN846DRAFT_893571 [Sphaerosporella brunnea]|uniref:Uncharacterized protein n=1 Tax=Sphaerosporella brunnea TaxID=1250544 RepID=A0A5J5EK94_9PEZI|nr:hypothetical protein FN846DRAFT_893571 [Sphaerosporella brunnea]